MRQIRHGLHVWKQDAPTLFGQIKGVLFAASTRVNLFNRTYRAVRDKDERGDFYVLFRES